MIQEYLISEMADILASREFERKLVQIVEERLDVPLLTLLRDRAAELLIGGQDACVRSWLWSWHSLRTRETRGWDAIMEWEKDLKEQVRGILEYLRQSESHPARLGVVESVGYCPSSGYFCTD